MLACFLSCTDESCKIVSIDDCFSPFNVSKEQAIEYAAALHATIKEDYTRSSENEIDESFAFKENNEPYAHVINYSGGGFIIIAGDRRMTPVLGYSEIGSLCETPSNYPVGFKIWLDNIRKVARFVREGQGDNAYSASAIAEWESFSFLKDTRSIPDNPGLPELRDTTVGPLLETMWHQGNPYNGYLSYAVDSAGITQTYHKYAGTSTVAIASLMRYYEYPSYFYWEGMPNSMSNSNLSPFLLSLIENVYSNINSFKGFNVINGYSYVKETFRLDNFLKNRYGFTSANQSSYNRNSNFTLVRNEILNNLRPVILSGNNDLTYLNERGYWICDGVHEYDTIVELSDGSQTVAGHLMFHHNWCDANFSPAWLAFSSFIPGALTDYSDNMRIVYGIIP